jgi:ketosteroid isomerase-like protein
MNAQDVSSAAQISAFGIQRRNQMRQILGTILLVIATFATGFSQCSDAEKKELEALDHAWSKAGLSGDKAALTNIYADDYVGFPGMEGKTAAVNNTMATFERNKANPAGADKVTYDHYRISCTPVTATITHRNTIWTPTGEGGKPATFYARSVHVLEKRGGKWQVVSNAGHDLDDYMTLGYLEQDWNNALLKRDKDWFDKNYAADFSSVSSTSAKLMNKAADIADTLDDKGTMELAETSDLDIRIDGRTAVITGIFRTKGKDDKGAAYDRRLRFTDTWIRRDGRWQAWATAGTNIP